MEGTRDGLDYLAGAGEDRFHLSEGKWCGCISHREHPGPSVSFNNIPTTCWRCQIAQCNAGFLVGPPPNMI
jgi:hypothetical protein